MKKFFSLLPALLVGFILLSCGESGPKPVEIESLELFENSTFRYSLMYPKNWENNSKNASERFYAISIKKASRRFFKYKTKGLPAAKIDFFTKALKDTVKTFEEQFQAIVDDKVFAPSAYSAPEKVTIDGVQAIKQTYAFELEDGPFYGEIYYAAKDSGMVSILSFETFANTYEKYAPQFKEIIASVKLAKTPEQLSDTVHNYQQAEPPTMTMKTKSGAGFSIGIPDNFNKEKAPSQGAEKTYNYMGAMRGDCFIRVDIFDASNATDLKKIVEENKGKFGGAAPKKITLGGKEAYMLSYKPSKTTKGEVTFTLNNKKLYRVMLNWFSAEEKNFLPAFKKSVSTFKFD